MMDRRNIVSAFCRVAALLLVLTGCYTRSPITTTAPEPSTRIIARLTDSGVVEMAGSIGTGAYEIEGVIAEADPTVWKLHLTRVEQRTGRSINWNKELVSFPRFALTDATEKRFDRTRSWMAAGLVVAGAILAAVAFGELGADEQINPPPPPPAIRVPGGGLKFRF
jgi:hypothetical protein